MVYLFDIDGTLTSPRKPMTKEFEQFFYNWMLNKKVYLVTGSDRKKVNEQTSLRIQDACSGIFCSMANELYVSEQISFERKVYENKIEFPETLKSWLEQQMIYSDFKNKTGNHFEYRPGMLNFSVVGRNATPEERDEYEQWDKQNGERNRIATYINRKFKDIEARVGGQISIDIQGKGKNKSQASQWIRDNIKDKMHFFGDRCIEGGNDYDIAQDIINHGDGNVTNVTGPDNLKTILESME